MSEPGPNTDLSFATDEELINELFSRYPYALVAMERDAPKEDDHTATLMVWRGGLTMALGLCDRVRIGVESRISAPHHRETRPDMETPE